MMMKNSVLTVTILLAWSLSGLLYAGELVQLIDGSKTAAGFLVDHEGKTYLYTSQTAILGMNITGIGKTSTVTTFSHKKLTLIGEFEISYYSDVARIQVNETFKDAYQIGKITTQGQQVTIFPNAGKNLDSSKQKTTINGIGIYAFTLNDNMKTESPGTPVLDPKGNVVGVLSTWVWEINRKKNLFVYTKRNPHFGARLDAPIKWVPISKVNFKSAANAILDSKRIQKEIIPLLNWWMANPYRQIPESVSYPVEIKRFVKYNNERTPLIRRFVKKISRNLIGNKAKMEKVRAGCIHRGELFSNFIHSQKRSLNGIKSGTQFLNMILIKNTKNWSLISGNVDAKLKGMDYTFPK